MGRQVDWDLAPKPGVALPEGTHVGVIELSEKQSSTEKLMYAAALTVVESSNPAAVGLMHVENFVIGTDADPDAEDPKTWQASIGFGRLKDFLTKATVPLSRDMEQTCLKAKGSRIVFVTTQEKEPDKDRTGQPNRFAGQTRTRVKAWHRVGEAPPVAAPQARAASRPRPSGLSAE